MFNKKKKTKKEPSQSFATSAEMSRIEKEFKTATDRYTDSVKRSNLFKSSAIYGNPWFMILGPQNSGKSSLLAGSELHFPLKYPDDKDGETASGVCWRFGNKAVWIDVPGRLLSGAQSDTFKAMFHALKECRAQRSVDAIICVISIEDILHGDPQSVKALASTLRAKLDELIAFWGIELPVFCVFSKADTIPGFYDFFNDASVQWSDHLLGATHSLEQQAGSPRKVFTQEHEVLCTSLKSLRLKRLSKEKHPLARRMICRFVIQFEGMQARLGDFFIELFKESAFEGKPVFKGFYFVSCKSFELSGDQSAPVATDQVDVSNTILNHPLNPHRMAAAAGASSQKEIINTKVKSFFTRKLFETVFPDGTQILQQTHSVSRKQLIRYWSVVALFSVIAAMCLWYGISSFITTSTLHSQTKTEVESAVVAPRSRAEAYQQLGRLGDLVAKYRQFAQHGAPLSYGLGIVGTDRIYESLKKVYVNRAWNFIVLPGQSYMEYGIKNFSATYGQLSGDDYSSLYRLLKTYLSMSEAVAQTSDKIDTLVIHETLESALHQIILQSEDRNSLPANIEIILQKNIGLYCAFLKEGAMPLIQENQEMVSQARSHLSQLPDAKVLYEAMRDRLKPTAPTIALSDLLGGKTDALLISTGTISAIYTQEGWERFVDAEINTVIKDPYKVDWVLGTTAESMGEQSIDKEQMRSDMVAAYLNDVYEQWLFYVQSVSLDPLGDIVRAGTVLQKLSASGSELSILLENVITLSGIDVTPKESAIEGAAKKMASKKLAKLEKNVSKMTGLQRSTNPAEKLKTAFDPLRAFVRSEGRLGGLSAYNDRLSVLAEALSKCARQGGTLSVFNGKSEDPLVAAWTLSQSLIAEMPEAIGMAMTPLLQKPLEYTGAALSTSVSKELNSAWQNDVAAVYTNKFAGKYPFKNSDDEAPFDEVMDFFRPNTGTIWGFYQARLSAYIAKDGAEWKSRPSGCMTIEFSKDIFSTLANAEKITNAFFNLDGTQMVQKIAILPLPQNKFQASLIQGGQEYRLLPDENRVRLLWPVAGQSGDITLKIVVNTKYTEEIKCTGMWGLMRLFEIAKINVLNNSSFVAKWERSVQNMLMIQYGCHVQIAGSAHPFGNRVFDRFDCPVDLIKK